jgi:hypothetical protein
MNPHKSARQWRRESGYPNDRSIHVLPAHRALKRSAAEREHPAIRRSQPVALAIRCGGYPHNRRVERCSTYRP